MRRARRQQCLTQAALAARSGTSRVTIARLETGSAGDVRLGTVSRVGEALGLEVAAVPLGGEPLLERHLEREREKVRRLERRLAHAVLAARLLAAPPREARALISAARAALERWERERLCSRHYIARWRALLSGPVGKVARALVEPDEWTDALFQTTPWAFAREAARARAALEEDRRWLGRGGPGRQSSKNVAEKGGRRPKDTRKA